MFDSGVRRPAESIYWNYAGQMGLLSALWVPREFAG